MKITRFVCLLAAAGLLACDDTAEQDLEACEAELVEVRGWTVAQRGEIDDLQVQTAELEAKKADLERQLADLTAAVAAIEGDLEVATGRADTCEADLLALGDPSDIAVQLARTPGLTIDEIDTSIPGARVFAGRIEQPVDHDRPDGPTLSQRFVLLHRDAARPMVLATTGYGLFGGPALWADFQEEITALSGANQIVLEHRYFEGSLPPHQDPQQIDWRHLTIRQSATDSHRLVQTLNPIYGGPWVATGHSKGGMTAIFHQRFYPDDLAGIVPYVAPISLAVEDERYTEWMAQIGPEDGACRQAIEDWALATVQNRVDLADSLRDADPVAGAFVPELVEAQIAFNAVPFAWGIWQGNGSPDLCRQVAGLPPVLDVETLATSTGFDPFGAIGYGDPYSAYFYQVQAELGGPSYAAPYLDDALADVDASALIEPAPPAWARGQQPVYDAEAMPAVLDFLVEEATNVLAVYGAWDPWTAGMIAVDEARGSKVFVAPETSHGAGIGDLAPADRTAALAMLEQMMGGGVGGDALRIYEPAPVVARQIERDRQWLMEQIARENRRLAVERGRLSR